MYRAVYAKDLEKTWSGICDKECIFNKCILVTGATGTIGAYLVDLLLWANQNKGSNIHIIAVSRKMESLKRLFGEENEYMTFLEHDINEPFEVDGSMDYIIHAAGNAYPELFRTDSVGTLLNSINGTHNVLELAKEKGAKLLYISSGEAFGSGLEAGKSWKEKDVGRVDTTAWRSCYPMGKRAAENLCVCYKEQFGLDVVMTRLCHTFGPNITKCDNRANAQFLLKAARKEEIVLLSEGLNRRSYLYVGDAVAAILSVLLKGQSGDLYNIAGDEVVSIKEFATLCAKAGSTEVVYKIPNDVETKEKTFIENQILANEKLKSLGWKPLFTIEEGIKTVIELLC